MNKKTKELIDRTRAATFLSSNMGIDRINALCAALEASEARVVELEAELGMFKMGFTAAPPASPGEDYGPIPEGWEYAGFRDNISPAEQYWAYGISEWSGRRLVGTLNGALDDKFHIIRKKECDTCLGTGAVGEYPCPECFKEEP